MVLEFSDRNKPRQPESHALERMMSDYSRAERLARFFPALAERLDQAINAARVHPSNRDQAARHYLCAESLAEALEERTRDGHGNQGDEEGEIINDYSRRAAQKVLAYDQRPSHERALIEETFHEVDLQVIRQGIEQQLLSGASVSAALEESNEYRSLIMRLR